MLYQKNQSPQLDMSLFRNPTAEYRGAPFWAWNCQLSEQELLWQIERLKEMGFGGFHMHTRSGMATKYLSDDFMSLIQACTQKAKEENMLAWLYDEDRWPSGAAGGFVTKDPRYRQRCLRMSIRKPEVLSKEQALKEGGAWLLACYDVVLNGQGELEQYRRCPEDTEPQGTLWYAFCEVYSSFSKSAGWYNGQTYVDTMSKAAISRFVKITHERYKEAVGTEFGKTVPAIFSDEPQLSHKVNLPFAHSKQDAILPWTPDFTESFREACSYDILDRLPELFWDRKDGAVSQARYHFHDQSCECFAAAFADTIGRWCQENGIHMTGHMYRETTLLQQAQTTGEVMRSYRSFHIPGIDMLFNGTEYDTAKQAQSAAHQYGREGVLSELYGVTNWDFDFRGHKTQGDWQAALGITVRVPHLSWVSMKGAAKRDYPASINYQVPWYREYPLIEDHFARLNTVLTRGKPVVNVAVIHPIESVWLHLGPEDSSFALLSQQEENYQNTIRWLLFGTMDFDFLCESTLPQLVGEIGPRLHVGAMDYGAILVPACETLRGTTLEILENFADAGGTVIFAGDVPKYVDALPDDRPRQLSERAVRVSFTRHSILSALQDQRLVEIRDQNGKTPRQFVYQLRRDGTQQFLFIANPEPPVDVWNNGTPEPTKASIRLKGAFVPTVLDTATGDELPAVFRQEGGYTTIFHEFHEQDSLLLRLVEGSGSREKPVLPKRIPLRTLDCKEAVEYIRQEDNVCLLDMAEYALDDGPFQPMEEILRIDKALREPFGWPLASGQDMQPWAMEKEPTEHSVTLRFRFRSELALEGLHFCAEELEALQLNGQPVFPVREGYFVDKSIGKYPLPPIREGENVLLARIPFNKQESLEACYLTGDFDVTLIGCEKVLKKAGKTVGFGDIVGQGMPFYGGNLTYRVPFHLDRDCNLHIDLAKYIGALTKVALDGENRGAIVFAPYTLEVKNVAAGDHILEFTLFGNRHNTFGGLHNCGDNIYYGQHYWYSEGQSWSYEYRIKPTGILKSPVITLYPADSET